MGFSSSSHDGVGIKHFSSSSHDKPKRVIEYVDRNPNPFNWEIKKSQQIDNILVVKIIYPNCKNYEGNKILVFENVALDELKKQKSIDPHFSDNDLYHNPIARFIPTVQGWRWAVSFANMIKI